MSGALSTGAAGVPVIVGVDESSITPGHVVTGSATTGAGGAYSTTITAPNTPDGLNKPGVNGAFGVDVSTTNASSVVTLEVSPQDCTTTSYTGATSAAVGSSAAGLGLR